MLYAQPVRLGLAGQIGQGGGIEPNFAAARGVGWRFGSYLTRSVGCPDASALGSRLAPREEPTSSAMGGGSLESTLTVCDSVVADGPSSRIIADVLESVLTGLGKRGGEVAGPPR